ncbi:hypothetical protein LLH00_03325 [bacterium]|nr:hypothetical protein [bacterium]
MSADGKSKTGGVIKHGTVLLVATVITGLSNTLFNILMGRMLPREEYGDYFGLISLYMILALPLNAVQVVTARYVSSLDSRRLLGQVSVLLRRSVLKLGLVAAALMAAFLVLGPFLRDYLNIRSLGAVYVTGLAVSLCVLSYVFWGALQGFQYFYHYSANQVLSTAVKLGSGVLLVWMGFQVAGALGSLVLCNVAVIVMAMFPLNVMIFKLSGGDSNVDSRPHYRFFWPVLISLLGFAVFTYADAIAVKHFFGRAEAGEYGFAQVVGKAFLFAPLAISTALFPKVSRLTASRERGSLQLLNMALLYCLLLCACGVVACMSFPHLILRILFPEGSDLAASLVRIFGLGMTPVALLNIQINFLLARGRSGFLYLFLPLAVAYAVALQLYHPSLTAVIWVMSAFGVLSFLCLYASVVWGELRRHRRPSLGFTRERGEALDD